jgi:hypothetical protein
MSISVPFRIAIRIPRALMGLCLAASVFSADPAPPGASHRASGPAAGTIAQESRIDFYSGMCDASAAALLDTSRFAVASDEDNILRVYDDPDSGPVSTLPLDRFLAIEPGAKNPETDIEACTRSGERIYWITSHGRDAKGRWRTNRHRFFATRIIRSASGLRLEAEGSAYRNLVFDLCADPRLAKAGLREAAGLGIKKAPSLAPKENGLNIEGLSRIPGSTGLMIGFRNPMPGGKALLVPLLNPDSLLSGAGKARFGQPVFLDLGGLSVRSIEYSDQAGAYILLAGRRGGGKDFRFCTWSGRSGDEPVEWRDPGVRMGQLEFTPEALTLLPETGALLVFSDDGERLFKTGAGIDARFCPCKRLDNPRLRKFRGIRLDGPLARNCVPSARTIGPESRTFGP